MRFYLFVYFSTFLSSLTYADYSQCQKFIAEVSAPEIAPLAAELPSNFHKVNDFLFRGARIENQAQADALAKLQIKTVINLQGGDYNSGLGSDLFGDKDWKNILPVLEAGETPAEIKAEAAELLKAGLPESGYKSLPIDSLSLVYGTEQKRIEQILAIINDPHTPRPIYIHCAHGADRTGLIVALYRVLSQNYCMNPAHEEWQALGHDDLHTTLTSALDVFFFTYLWNEIYLKR